MVGGDLNGGTGKEPCLDLGQDWGKRIRTNRSVAAVKGSNWRNQSNIFNGLTGCCRRHN